MASRKTFKNLYNIELKITYKNILRWGLEKRKKVKDHTFLVPHATDKKIAYLKENRTDATITWIGHSSFFIQMSGLNILTDPVWAKRMGFAKRLVEPGIFSDELPVIDVVLISHNHYDHLDIPSLKKLRGSPVFFVPKAMKVFFQKRGFKNVEEFDWWSKKQVKNTIFSFVPAQHWSKRTLWDTNKSLWGGWVIYSNQPETKCIYFVGDSGYFEGFKEIGKKFDIEYILAPIGAYEPEWLTYIQHISPEEAVQAFIDSGAKKFIQMHYDAFRLSDESSFEALERLQEDWTRQKIDLSKLKILKLGETIDAE